MQPTHTDIATTRRYVTAAPAKVEPAVDLFSVEYFIEEMREQACRWSDVRLLGLEYVKVFAGSEHPGTEVRDMGRIRNILAAVEIVRAEQDGASR